MKNVMNGQATASTVAPTLHLGTLRRNIMAVVSADVFTPAERLRANHNVYECEDAARLALWLKNVRRVFAEREIASEPTAELVEYATAQQKEEIAKLLARPCLTKPERTRALLQLPRLDKAQATLLIGELWAKILHRDGGGAPTAGHLSYPAAA